MKIMNYGIKNMNNMKSGALWRRRLAALLRRPGSTFSPYQAAQVWKMDRIGASKILSRLVAQGWLTRLRRGTYMARPMEVSLAGEVAEDPWIVGSALYSPCYIGGWSAAEYWGYTEQIFRTVIVITTRVVREREFTAAGTPFLIRTISAKKFFGTKPVWRETEKVLVSDPEKTIIDLLDSPKLGGGIRPVSDILLTYWRSKHKDSETLLLYAGRIGNSAVFKRLGFLAERVLSAEKDFIVRCKAGIAKGASKLDPTIPGGRFESSWRLYVPESWVEKK